ncbi:hypothetical protein SAMN04488516_10915 [Desulfonauticus submarinus]|uniref:MEMO1 family protein SAMN04488516_10915 n=1 Tax=Desulfonauticus submarinus TaxID=206665 RepID=A0A1H0ERD6_9BACT|nr:AmmeMemoRadiSam system protein B [Desulfonauticus submarinus]SDN84905.1 hypothetical protein SAMN04488516_10915 [Desulfonauticus submarinus]
MDRNPVVAGQFYPENKEKLFQEVASFLQGEPRKTPTILSMVPHAGYIYSGKICGKTLASSQLKPTILLLGPNHTGKGAKLALWPEGKWFIPGGYLEVNSELAIQLNEISQIKFDYEAHLFEHSLEVILPFLFYLNPQTTIIPICVSEYNFEILQQTADQLANILDPQKTTIIVSSDMSHYVPHDIAYTKDHKALKHILNLDVLGLIESVQKHNISMCGILPMTLGLLIAKKWNACKGILIDYATSGEVSGDFNQVVGYAGVIVE